MRMTDFSKLRKLKRAFPQCAILVLAPAMVFGQNATTPALKGIPWDASHHHLIFSNPSTPEQAAKLQQESRFWHQVYHRNAISGAQTSTEIESDASTSASTSLSASTSASSSAAKSKGLWGESYSGTTAGTVGAGNYPAKYSFTNTASCSDYVVFNTSLAGAGSAANFVGTIATLSSSNISSSSTLEVKTVTFDASPPVAATVSGTFTGTTTTSGNITIKNGTNTLTMTPNTSSTTSSAQGTFTGTPNSGGTITVAGVVFTASTSVSSPGNCSSATAGTYLINGTNGSATNLFNTIGSASCQTTYAVPFTATNPSAGKVTVTAKTAGLQGNLAPTASTTNFSWTTITAGAGGNYCTSSTTGGFTTSTTVTTSASDLVAAIAFCPATIGVSAATTGSGGIKLTALTAGTGGNSIDVSESLSDFSWAGSATALSGGSDGVTSGTSTPPTFAYWSVNAYLTPAALAANIATAINANTTLTGSTGVSATSNGANLTLTARTTGTAANSYAVTATSFTAFTPSSGDLSGGTTGTAQPSIVAYTNIYASTCTGPTVQFAYNTGGTISTSVALSTDGTQLAFIHSNSSGASLVILNWNAGDGAVATPATPSTVYTNVVNGSSYGTQYQTCRSNLTSCMLVIPFNNLKNDTNSSPFYDYDTDVLWVGDDSGNLHEFTGVFLGAPAEVTTGDWPAAISANKLTSPTYDYDGHIFIADSGGYLWSYPSGGGTATSTSRLAIGTEGIVDAPLVDSSTAMVYVFVGQDGNTSTSKNCDNATGCDGVFRFSTTIGSSGAGSTCASSNGTSWTSGTNCGSESVFGSGSSTTVIYDGTFDNAYYTSGGTSGNLWTCAAKPGPEPRLNYSPLSGFSTVSVSSTAINPIVSGNATCSPLTEIFSSSVDYIYLSVTANGNLTGCTGACVYSFNVTSTVPTTSSAGLAASGGASGIIVDNTASGGGSQIYFSYLSAATATIECPAGGTATSGGCGVQASQAALK